MAEITLLNKTVFQNGVEVSNKDVIGWDGGDNGLTRQRVLRYEFASPDIGANQITISLEGIKIGSSTMPELYFYITTDATSYSQADENSPHYTLTRTQSGSNYNFSATEKFLLLPKTKYYVWFFVPRRGYRYYYYYGDSGKITPSGAAGITKIYTNKAWVDALTYVYTQGQWKLAMPYIYTKNSDNTYSWKNTC